MAVNRELKELLSRIKFFKGVNQKDIALALSVKPTYLSDVVNGRVPFSDNLRKKLHELYTDCLQEKGTTEADFLDEMKCVDVKQFRIANSLTQSELGEYLGIKKSFVSLIENGKAALPNDKFVKLINNDRGWDTSMFDKSHFIAKGNATMEGSSPVFNEAEAWEVIRNQAASLKERDDMISRMISISERSLIQVERAMDNYDRLFSALSGDFAAYNPYAGRREGKNPPPIKTDKK